MSIGIISDTHGLLRPEAVRLLQGSELIIHAGDVGDPAILDELRRIAPVVAVRGNIDKGAWADTLPENEAVDFHGKLIYVIHEISKLDLDPAAAGFAAVIYGHSHKAAIKEKNGLLFFNPGSAGPRRFKLPVTLGRTSIIEDRLTAVILGIENS